MEDNKIQLIKIYQENLCLCEYSLAEYHDRNKRNVILYDLAEELNCKGKQYLL